MVLRLQEQRNTFGSFEFEWLGQEGAETRACGKKEGGGPGLGLRRRGRERRPALGTQKAGTEEWVLGGLGKALDQTWALRNGDGTALLSSSFHRTAARS